MSESWQAHVRTFQKWAGRLSQPLDTGVAATAGAPAPGQPPAGVAQLSDVKVEGSGGGGWSASMADGKVLEELQRAQVELLLALPALYHRQDPTRPPKIWNPFGELRPGFVDQYNKHLQARGNTDHKMVWMVPALYVFAWTLDLIIYFGVQNARK